MNTDQEKPKPLKRGGTEDAEEKFLAFRSPDHPDRRISSVLSVVRFGFFAELHAPVPERDLSPLLQLL
jgi:hypothetical protein